MATVSITRDWGEDAGSVEVIVDVDESFPDAVSECTANAVRAFTEAMNLAIVSEPDE